MRRLAFLLLLVSLRALGQPEISFDERLGSTVPGEVSFREARLADYYGRAPIVLVLGYFGCVNLCGTTLTGVDEALRDTGLAADLDYRALFVSIDARDEKAASERRPGWHFLTGGAAAARVAQAIGFRYRFEKESGEFAHPAGFVVLTPEGRIAQYFEGVRFDAGELKKTLIEASRGKTQSAFQRLLFVCFHDPLGGRHTPAAMAGVRIAMLTLLGAAGFLAWRRLR